MVSQPADAILTRLAQQPHLGADARNAEPHAPWVWARQKARFAVVVPIMLGGSRCGENGAVKKRRRCFFLGGKKKKKKREEHSCLVF